MLEAALSGCALVLGDIAEPGREILVAQDGLMVAEHLRNLTPEVERCAMGQSAIVF